MEENYRLKDGLTKKNLFWLLKQQAIEYHYSMKRDELFDLLIDNGMKPLDFYFETIFCASMFDYMNCFNLTKDEFIKLNNSGILKTIYIKEVMKNKQRFVVPYFSLKQFFELTEDEVRSNLLKHS